MTLALRRWSMGANYVVLAVCVGLSCPGLAVGQPESPEGAGFSEVTSFEPRHPSEGLIPSTDADAESWLRRAVEARQRKEWKLASDTLRTVIDEYGDRIVTMDAGWHFYSATRLAREQLTSWPEEGIATYRFLYDAGARRQLEEARESYDLDALRLIARRYSMTTPGPDAIHLLATWLLDREEAGEAVALLERLQALPHCRVPSWQIFQKLALAYALQGQEDRGRDALSAMRALGTDENDALPGDWPERIGAIERFLNGRLRAGQDSSRRGHVGVRAWPQMLGPALSAGRMSGIEPAVVPKPVWADSLPGSEQADVAQIADLMAKTNRIPVWQAVSDGKRLFVTCPSGLIARDLATFDFLWQAFPRSRSRDPRVTQRRLRPGFMPGSKDSGGARGGSCVVPLTHRTLCHEYAGAVSTAFGLVFVIEQPETTGEQLLTLQGVLPPNDLAVDEFSAEPNSLRAFEADTGRAVWTKGRGGPVEDDLKSVHFFAAPVVAGTHLVVPYQQQNELYLAVLRPDGSLERKVPIGSGRPGMLPMNGVLQPTVCEGTIFIPTGAGLLVALDAFDFSLQWLSMYERVRLADNRVRHFNRASSTQAQPDEWIGSPPVIASGLVLLAAHDSDRLIACDRHTGEVRWAFARGHHRYVVAADAQRVYVAGRGIAAVDLVSGKAVWRFDAVRPTGRVALSGEHIFVPTASGLLRLKAATGERVGVTLDSGEPLGNLLAFDGSLYSVGAASIQKYPDVALSRANAREQLERRPSDADSLLRLAWMAVLEDDWEGALSFLKRADVGELGESREELVSGETLSDSGGGVAMAARIVHLRVFCMLKLAAESSSDSSVEGRLKLLEEATHLAVRPDDVVLAGLAYCDAVAEEGDAASAFARALALLMDVGDESVFLGGQLRGRASILIGERMRRLWSHLDEEQRLAALRPVGVFMGSGADSPASAGGGGGVGRWDQVVRLSDTIGFTTVGASLDLVLGRREISEGAPESAVFFLERAVRRASGSAVAMESLALLTLAYARSGGDLPVARGETGRAFPAILNSEVSLRLVRDEIVAFRGNDCQSFFDRNKVRAFCRDPVVVQVSGQVKGLHSNAKGDLRVCWSAALDREAVSRAVSLGDGPVYQPQAATVAGRIGVMAARGQVLGVGLTSGRVMWPPLSLHQNRADLPDPPIVSAEGIVFIAPGGTALVAIPAREDAKPIWRHRLPADDIRTMEVVGGELVVVDGVAGTLLVLDPLTGRIRRSLDISERGNASTTATSSPALGEADAHVAIVGDVVCRSGVKCVTAWDIHTGRKRWTLQRNGRIKDVRKLDAQHVGVCYRGHHYVVVRCDTGAIVKEIEATGMSMPPQIATLDRPNPRHLSGEKPGQSSLRLLLFAGTDEDPPEYKLLSYPLEGNGEEWSRSLGDYATASEQMLHGSPDYLTVIQYELTGWGEGDDVALDGPAIHNGRLLAFDKISGERLLRRPFVFEDGRLADQHHRSRLITDVIVTDNCIVAIAPEGYFVLGKDDSDGASPVSGGEP